MNQTEQMNDTESTLNDSVSVVHWTEIKQTCTAISPSMLAGVTLSVNCNLVGEKGRLGVRKYRPVKFDTDYVVYKATQALMPLILALVYTDGSLVSEEQLDRIVKEVIVRNQSTIEGFKTAGLALNEISTAAVLRRFRQLVADNIDSIVEA